MVAKEQQLIDLATVVPILIGVLIGLVPPWLARKQRLRTHWSAMRAEIKMCHEKALEHRNRQPEVMAPLYRLPTVAYVTSFPVLLADAAISEVDIATISDFYDMVHQLNRGLDLAANENNPVKLDQLHARNKIKVGHILDAERDRSSLFERAVAVADRKINGRWWRYDSKA